MAEKPTFEQLRTELNELAHELDPWYTIGKVKWYMVSVYTKDDPDDNIFDILSDGINWYDDQCIPPSEVFSVIGKIQAKMKEIDRRYWQ